MELLKHHELVLQELVGKKGFPAEVVEDYITEELARDPKYGVDNPAFRNRWQEGLTSLVTRMRREEESILILAETSPPDLVCEMCPNIDDLETCRPSATGEKYIIHGKFFM